MKTNPMKKNILFGFFLLTGSVTYAQLTVNAKKLTVSDSLSIDSTTIGAISNDTSSLHRDSTSLITEWAAKKYADGHGGGSSRLHDISDTMVIKTGYTDGDDWHYNSILMGIGVTTSAQQELKNNPQIGAKSLVVTNRYFGSLGSSFQNVIFGGLPDGIGSFNTIVGEKFGNGSNVVGSYNTIVGSNVESWGTTNLGNYNVSIGFHYHNGGDGNILIGGITSPILTQGGTNPSLNRNNQINIGNYLLKDSVGHFGVSKWPQKSAAIDLGSNFSDGGLLTPKGTSAQRLAIVNPEEGLFFYDITLHALCVYNGSRWQKVPTTDVD